MDHLEPIHSCKKYKGIKIFDEQHKTYKMFANDLEISLEDKKWGFLEIMKVLRSYERVVGVKLNLAKSIIIPLFCDLKNPTMDCSIWMQNFRRRYHR